MSARTEHPPAARAPWLTTSRRIGLLVTVVAATAATLYVAVVRDLPGFDAPLTLPWLVWVAAFAAGELLVVHIQLQRDSHSFSLTDLVLVAGLYLVAPAELITAQLAGAGLALVLHRRQFGLKLAFNLAQYALSGCLATILFAVLSQDATLSGAWNWVAGLAAVAVSTVAAGLCIFAAISLSQGYLGLRALPRMLGLSMPFALAMAAFGLLAAQIAMQNPASLILLALPSVLLITAYRAYAKAREQQNNLRLLHEVTSLLYASDDAPTALTDFLTAVRGAFRAADRRTRPVRRGRRASRRSAAAARARTPSRCDPWSTGRTPTGWSRGPRRPAYPRPGPAPPAGRSWSATPPGTASRTPWSRC